jgi:hypothetical protein
MLPGPPQAPSASEVGSDELLLSWQPPASAVTLGVQAYRVFVQAGGTSGFAEHTHSTGSAECACRVRGLQPNTWYEFRVAALTAHGVGSSSSSSLPVQTTAPLLGAADREGRRHMAREYKRLKRRLKDWEVDFEQAHGRAPTADDRALVPPIAELYRRVSAVKAKLVVTIKDHMEGVGGSTGPRPGGGAAFGAGGGAAGAGAAGGGGGGADDGPAMPTTQEVAAIEMLFHDFDVSGDGVIDLDEFQLVMELASVFTGKTYSSKHVATAFKHADRDSSGGVDFNEFIALWRRKDWMRSAVAERRESMAHGGSSSFVNGASFVRRVQLGPTPGPATNRTSHNMPATNNPCALCPFG